MKKKTIHMSYCGMELPFKLYSFKYIWDELNKNKNLFGSIVQVNDADNKKITKCCNLEQHTRFFTYIKFCMALRCTECTDKLCTQYCRKLRNK